MPTPKVLAAVDAEVIRSGMARVREELGIRVEHPPAAVVEAEQAIQAATWRSDGRPDRTDVELVTIDPPGSRDLDQAYRAERRAGGAFRVWYAIADVAAFVRPGGELDAECHRRGVTFYGPDVRAPLHPPMLSEDAGSLLPDGDRPALLWCIDLDPDGAPTATRLERAVVRSRAQLTYADVVTQIDAGTAPEALVLLREIGELRRAVEIARGGVSLPIPEQIVEPDDGGYRLAYDAPIVSEAWNAEISLLTGMEAARIMLAGGSGLLRTLERPDDRALAELRAAADALGAPWPDEGGYPAFIRSLDATTATGAALLVQATRVLRGAGYLGFTEGSPAGAVHSAVAAPYAHVTAPLRRLCDRATNEVVLAHVEGRTPPEWALAEIMLLPDVMADARRREGAYSEATLDLVEALVLQPLVGQSFDAVVVKVDPKRDRVQVQLRDPAVVTWATPANGATLGDEVRATLRAADPRERHIDLAIDR